MTIGMLHPGQMGAAVATQLRDQGNRVLWCPDGRSRSTVARADAAGLEAVASLADLLSQSDLVLSVCPPAFAEDTAAAVAGHDYSGVFVDANAISPQRMQRIADLLPNADVVDGGIIGPPPRGTVGTRLYLSGPDRPRAAAARAFEGTDVEVHGLGTDLGKASALKMSFASFQKASRALAAVAHALAEHHGVQAELQAVAERTGPSTLAQLDYLPSLAARAWRWAPEMSEVAAALHDAGLPADLALGAERVLERWSDDKDSWDIAIPEVLEHLRLPETDSGA